MNVFFAVLGIIFGFSGAPNLAADTHTDPFEEPAVFNNAQVSLDTCFLAEEIAAADRLLVYDEIEVILKDRDYAKVVSRYNESYNCELYSDLYEYSIAGIDQFLFDNQSLAAVRQIFIDAEAAGTNPIRLWVVLAIRYDYQQFLGEAVSAYIQELQPPN